MAVDVSKFIARIQQHRAKLMPVAARAVGRYTAMVIGVAQNLCPVDTGALAASGTWLSPEIHGTKVMCLGGFNTDYAAAVHEVLDAHHEIGQAKFLEAAMKQMAGGFNEYMAGEIRGAGLG